MPAAVRVTEVTETLPAVGGDFQGVYGPPNSGDSMRVYLDLRDWRDMGYPKEIKVTVERVGE